MVKIKWLHRECKIDDDICTGDEYLVSEFNYFVGLYPPSPSYGDYEEFIAQQLLNSFPDSEVIERRKTGNNIPGPVVY